MDGWVDIWKGRETIWMNRQDSELMDGWKEGNVFCHYKWVTIRQQQPWSTEQYDLASVRTETDQWPNNLQDSQYDAFQQTTTHEWMERYMDGWMDRPASRYTASTYLPLKSAVERSCETKKSTRGITNSGDTPVKLSTSIGWRHLKNNKPCALDANTSSYMYVFCIPSNCQCSQSSNYSTCKQQLMWLCCCWATTVGQKHCYPLVRSMPV